VENIAYWYALSNPSFSLWLVRGFGTAIMHGGSTAVCAIVGKALSDRGSMPKGVAWGIALAIAIAIHCFFNQFFVSPVIQAAAIVLLLPPLVFAIFQRSERALEQWLNVGFDADTELLELILSGKVSGSPVGAYFGQLKDRFSGAVVVD